MSSKDNCCTDWTWIRQFQPLTWTGKRENLRRKNCRNLATRGVWRHWPILQPLCCCHISCLQMKTRRFSSSPRKYRFSEVARQFDKRNRDDSFNIWMDLTSKPFLFIFRNSFISYINRNICWIIKNILSKNHSFTCSFNDFNWITSPMNVLLLCTKLPPTITLASS